MSDTLKRPKGPKGPINPPDGLSPGDYVEPPVGKVKTTYLPDIEQLGVFAGEKVAGLGVADAREVRLMLQKCLTRASYERYKEKSECPTKSVKADVVKDIRLLIEVLHHQGPANMVVIEKIINALKLGMSVEEIGDKFKIPLNRLNADSEVQEGTANLTNLPDNLLRLLGAAIVVRAQGLPGNDTLEKIAQALSAQKASEVVQQAQQSEGGAP